MNAPRRLARRRAPLVAGVLLVAACSASAPSAANPPDDAPQDADGPSAHFVLSITPVEGEGEGEPADTDEPATGDEEADQSNQYDWWAKSKAVLACNPDGGTHPDPGSACLSLRDADGDFEQLPMVPRGCPRIYAPVEVEAIGYWDDERVDYTETFSNRCEAANGTGSVFDF